MTKTSANRRLRLDMLAQTAGMMALVGCASPDFSARADLSALRPGAATLSIVDAIAPSPEIGRRYAAALQREAEARGYAVIPADSGQPSLKLRAYLDAFPVDATRTAYAYVVHTSPDGRSPGERVNGAATVNLPMANAWSNMDDATMRQLARQSLDDLTRVLSGNPAPSASSEE